MSRRDWTEAQARAWLKASLPRGWRTTMWLPTFTVSAEADNNGHEVSIFNMSGPKPTLRAACLALVRAAKRAGVNVNAAPEPKGGGR